MNKVQPLTSVIMPSYNHEKYIEDAIRSVWNQTYKNVELIVLDDGSKDKSPEIIKKLEEISPIPMKVVLKENEGICRTLNKGLELSEGVFIGFLASDDIYLDNKISDQVQAFQKLDNSYAVVYSDGFHMDDSGRKIDRKLYHNLRKNLENDESIFIKILTDRIINYPQAALFRKTAIQDVEGFDDELTFEDLDLNLRLAKKYKFYFLDVDVVYYRVMGDGLREKLREEDILNVVLKHISFLDKKEQIDVLRYRYMKFAERNFYLCNVSKGLNYYWKLLQLKTVNLYYYKYFLRFLLRCIVIKIIGEEVFVKFKD